MGYESVEYRVEAKVAYIGLNRPQVLNAFNAQLEQDLRSALEAFDRDEQAWVAVVYGNGRCFSAGADVKERFYGQERSDRLYDLGLGPRPEGYLGRTLNWKPVIAAVHGYCLGAGFSLALECDLIVASEDARFAITETQRGLSGARVWAKLHFFMASKVATEMVLTGEMFSAAELGRLGLINRVVPQGQHLEEARRLAEKLLELPPLAVRAGVRATRWPWLKAVLEADYYIQPLRLHMTEDFEESSRAFVEKRKPVYRGK
ncbi:MAG: enoyl-CoA hydratase [Nitrososphaera sp.]